MEQQVDLRETEIENVPGVTPQQFYIICALVGGLVLTNLGTIVALIWVAGKGVWNLSAFNQRFLAVEKDVNNFFGKHREAEYKVSELEKGHAVLETVINNHHNRLVIVETRRGNK